MSMAALADEEILRTDRRNLRLGPLVAAHVDPAVANLDNLNDQQRTQLRTQLQAALQPLAAEKPIQNTPQSSALDGLVKYIPTESITLYVAATAAISSLKATFPSLTPLGLYVAFVALTPVLFLLIYLGKRRSQGLPILPPAVAEWPWWKLIASTIAFAVWALAVPPLVDSDPGKVVAAFGALLVSTILSLIGGVVEPAPAPAAP
jgi:hypothetical protein